ncbi:type VII secretion protein EssC [Paenibacillus sp. 481]|uniref:type VII secretion protein EssC n=1 Tax=Paenibacillus sp. 481 TaxID=2835869 RepID=UPI001E37C72F|nr:type VII secretion protein EssC [Paenibacillus sp. 481]UHA72074.1 type VII secretion protein EssC [Paenibacillus sp. 481]
MSRISYQRSPRVVPPIARTEVEIFKPSMAPPAPVFNTVMIVIPLLMTVAGAAAMFYFSRRMQNSHFLVFQIISLATVAVSYTLPFFMYIQQKKQFRNQMTERERAYKQQLERHQQELTEQSDEFRQRMLKTHPSAQQCSNIAEQLERELWERGPTEEDFMSVRIGLGDVKFPVRVKAPRMDGYDQDPLLDEALHLQAQFDVVPHTPVLVDFKKSRVVGLVGDRQRVNGVIRFLLMQCAVHHAPDELKLAAFFRAHEGPQWDWLRWLPHTWNDNHSWRMVCKESHYTNQQLEWLHAALQRRIMQKKSSSDAKLMLPQWLVLITDLRMLEDEPLLSLLLKEAKGCGASTLIVADRREQLPNDCQIIIDVHAEDEARLIHTVMQELDPQRWSRDVGDPRASLSTGVEKVVPDSISVEEANRFARRLAPIEVKKAAAEELPDVLTLMELLQLRNMEEWDAASKWNASRYPLTLPAVVGVRGGSKPVVLNIHDKIERKGHGPHGLVAGTTGSGKSEAIQSLIASLAVNYHPHDVAFMLIDYKGGGMSNVFLDLPHVIATVTNLEEEGLIERAKISLRAELERRQKLFVAAGNVQHIDEYYASSHKSTYPLPHLVIIIDEFAQLKKDEPEFMSELVSIAAIGRTLGVHLLLATQKPSGVVDDKIWSNSRYRICLRVQDEADSRDMLKVPNAAWLTTPGRGYIQVGSNEWFEMVQFAWSGAPYYPNASEEQEARIHVSTLDLNGEAERVKLPNNQTDQAIQTTQAVQKHKQLQVIIDQLSRSAVRHGIERLPGPWLPPLPQQIALQAVRGGEEPTWLQPIIGLVDDMAQQQQPSLRMDLSTGHWLIYGMPGTGKTTLVQTFITSLALDHSPQDVHVYVLDMGRMLSDFSLLPQVGDVIQEDEAEKIVRFIKMMQQELMHRKQLFAEIGAKTLASYREETGICLPAWVVVIDGYATFRSSYPEENDRLEPLLREGANFGLYAVITANRLSDVQERMRSNFANAMTLMLADSSDYYYAVGRPSKLPSHMPEGRGFVKGKVPPLMFQAALPIEAEQDTSRARQLRKSFELLNEQWTGARPAKIATLPARISLSDLIDQPLDESPSVQCATHRGEGDVVLGWMAEELTPFHIRLEDGPYFMVAGRVESGKTTALLTWSLSLAARMHPEQLKLHLVDFSRMNEGLYGLRHLKHVRGCATDLAAFEQMLEQIEQEMEQAIAAWEVTEQPAELPVTVLVMDDLDLIAKQLAGSFQAAQRLETLLKRGRGKNFYIIAAAGANDWIQLWDSWVKEIKSTPIGILLGTTDLNDLQLFQFKLPYEQCNKVLEPGEGFYVKRKAVRMKMAVPDPNVNHVVQQLNTKQLSPSL